MLAIYKYPLPIDDVVEVVMPKGAQVLHCAMQHGYPQIWALVDLHDPAIVVRRFRFAGTGHPIDIDSDLMRFVSTFFTDLEGTQVFHVFELLDPESPSGT